MFFFLSCVCYAFVRACLYLPCGHLLGKTLRSYIKQTIAIQAVCIERAFGMIKTFS